MEHDFAHVVATGELERPRGIRGRLLGRQDPPAEDERHAVVLVLANGARVRASGRTAGERTWADATRWMKVDVGAHELSYDVPLSEPTGRVGLVATVTVRCRVADPVGAIDEEATGVRELLTQPLRRDVANAYGSPEAMSGDDPIAVLNGTRAAAHARLDALVGGEVAGPSWLRVTVASVAVAFDEPTRGHHDELLRHARQKDMIASETSTRVAEMEGEGAIGAARRKAFADRLNSEWDIMFEATIADPTPERLERFAARLREFKRDDLDAAMTAYRFAVENGLESGELLEHVRLLLPGEAPAPEGAPALPRTGQQRGPETGGDSDWSRRPQ